MKWLYIILSIYITVLSCIPCSDENECNVTTSNITIIDNHQEHEHEAEMCSPFCICNCCGCSGITLIQSHSIDYKITVDIVTVSNMYVPAFIDNYTGSVWQPPKIG